MEGDAFDIAPNIHSHYEERYREEERLTRSQGLLEFMRSRELMARYLPPPPAVVLDVGGGTGAYALPLASEGYEVHLIDPVERHVALAREASDKQPDAPVASIRRGEARDLQRDDESVDAVLMLGPLYHLTSRAERREALREASRVMTLNGVLFAAAISRFASTYDGLMWGFMADPEFEAIAEQDVADGQHRNPTERPEWFTTAFFHHPDELREELLESGLDLEGVFAVEGPGGVLADLRGWLRDEERREVLLRAIRRVERDPSILGASAHLLGVARRR